MSRTRDITGSYIGSLEAIKPDGLNKYGKQLWSFRCVCGKSRTGLPSALRQQVTEENKHLPSCGCIKAKSRRKHGYRLNNKAEHPLYKSYRYMMTRCYNPNSNRYYCYGGAGVTVCDEWKGDPGAFIDWGIANGWKPGLTLDKDALCIQLGISPRIYAPHTCLFMTGAENSSIAANRSNYGRKATIKLSYDDIEMIKFLYENEEKLTQAELGIRYGVSRTTINKVLKEKSPKLEL